MALSKKERGERYAVGRLAEHLNRVDGTDYEIDPIAPPEPADVRLLSKLKAFPPVDVQVVSCPIEGGQGRNSHGNTDQLCSDLSKRLVAAGVVDVVASIHVQDSIFNHGVPAAGIQLLAEMIIELRPPANALYHNEEIGDGELFAVDPDLVDSFTNVSLLFNSGHDEPFVSVPLAIWIPEDDRLIQDAVQLKRVGKKYDPKAMSNLVLLIDAHWSVDNNQVASYRERLAPEIPDFKEIWIVGPFTRPTRLKP